MPQPRLLDLSQNQILAALPPRDQKRLLPHLDLVSLRRNQMLYRPGEPIHHVYFPIDAVISFLSTMQDGTSVEVGLIGNEGMLGIIVLLGIESNVYTVVIQVPGVALRLKVDVLRQEFKRGGILQDQLLHFTGSALLQIAQTAACNRVHLLENRLCRWLLMIQDRTKRNDFPFTQEFLSQMLGTPRPQVNIAAGILQHSGWIRQDRGKITILDREKLEERACECYRIVKND